MQDITHTTYDGGANPYAAGGGAAGSVATAEVYNELPAAQRSIMTFIASRAQDPEQGEEGIHVEAVVRSMGGSEAKVRAEIATLIEDGHLYETIDDQQCVLLLSLSLSRFLNEWNLAHLVLMSNPGLYSVLPTA